MAIDYIGEDYIDEHYCQKEVFHDMINKVLELVALNKNSHIAHEWYFIDVLIKEIENNNKLADIFTMYVLQYYPNYRWLDFKINDYLGTVILECSFQRFQFQQKCDLDTIDNRFCDLSQAMLFGEIVTDFLIRYCGYSLIKSSGQNIILTSRNDCTKRFEELLYQGYSLQRRRRVIYTDISKLNVDVNKHPGIKGVFYKLPVIPTKDIDLPIDEIIEVSNGNYERVLTSAKKYLE